MRRQTYYQKEKGKKSKGGGRESDGATDGRPCCPVWPAEAMVVVVVAES